MRPETSRSDDISQEKPELAVRLKDVEQRLEAFSIWQDNIRETIWKFEDEIDQLHTDIHELQVTLEETEATAEQAMTIASRGHSPEGKSQTQATKEVTRDELVRRAANGVTGPNRKLTVSEVADIVDREYGKKPAWAVVDRAWAQLTNEWPQFEEAKKEGNKALRLRTGDVTTGLVRTVEVSLGRSDLAKRFGGTEPPTGTER